MTLARCVVQETYDGHFAFEWPSSNDWWQRGEIVKMMKDFKMKTVDFHGCRLGARAANGKLTKKPWRLATTSRDLVEEFSELVCDHRFRAALNPAEKREHEDHEPIIGGKMSALSAFYPLEMAKKAHAVFRRHFHREDVMAHILEAAAPAVESQLLSAFDVDTWWIVDTGSGRDLAEASKCKPFKWYISAALEVVLKTGGGKVKSDVALNCAMNLDGFISRVNAYQVKNAPSVISVGARVCRYGFAFVWFPGFLPGLIAPNGCVIALHEIHNMPYISARVIYDAIRDPETAQRKVGVSVRD